MQTNNNQQNRLPQFDASILQRLFKKGNVKIQQQKSPFITNVYLKPQSGSVTCRAQKFKKHSTTSSLLTSPRLMSPKEQVEVIHYLKLKNQTLQEENRQKASLIAKLLSDIDKPGSNAKIKNNFYKPLLKLPKEFHIQI